MSKVSILAKNVPFETVLIVFLFCDVSQCCEEFVPHNRNLVYRVPLCHFFKFILRWEPFFSGQALPFLYINVTFS